MNPADQFETIVSQYYEPLFKFALSLTHAESDAQDLTQQTFYIWATKGHQLRDGSKVKTWLFTTLHRTFLQARRRHRKFPHHVLEEVTEQLPAINPGPYDSGDSAQVLAALATMDEIHRAAVALFYLQQCSYKEIAAILDVPLGTVKSRIARGILTLREILVAQDARVTVAAAMETRIAPRHGKSPPRQHPLLFKPITGSPSDCLPRMLPGQRGLSPIQLPEPRAPF
jgi:RNA polymerase sigma-70 factor (ECF subfamily)